MTPRFGRLDALRGTAMVWMAVFHFCFDLAHFRFVAFDFRSDPFWLWQRVAIVSLFLLCAGAGQAIAMAQGQGWPRFWRRWAQVAGCAVLVSIASWWMFPRTWISFGVLHGMAVMLIVARLAAPLGRWLWLVGLLAIALPQLVAHPFFDSPLTRWIGLVTRKPATEDFVPVFPWLGVMLWGLAAGQWLVRRQPAWFVAEGPPVVQPLSVLGRWSLSFYMLHQPVLIGLLWLVTRLR
jgi:uncharacterized membrane protein